MVNSMTRSTAQNNASSTFFSAAYFSQAPLCASVIRILAVARHPFLLSVIQYTSIPHTPDGRGGSTGLGGGSVLLTKSDLMINHLWTGKWFFWIVSSFFKLSKTDTKKEALFLVWLYLLLLQLITLTTPCLEQAPPIANYKWNATRK